MSLAAVKRAHGYKWFTIEELHAVIPDDVTRYVTVDQLRPICDGLVDSGDLKVQLRDDVLRYRFAKTRTARMLVERVNALTPSGESWNEAEIPTVAMLLDRAREAGHQDDGLRRITATFEEIEQARDELVEVMRCLNLPTARNRPANAEIRAWTQRTLRTVNEVLRTHPRRPQPLPLCVTCRTRERHFGDYCKRCCPPEERPHGKVA